MVFLGTAAYYLAPRLSPRSDIILPLSDCDLNQGNCQTVLPNGERMVFSIEPRPIPAVKPLQLQLIVDRNDLRQVEVDFAGATMQMGYNRTRLAKQADGQRFIGQATLPICTTGAMQWQATVILDTGTASIAVPFHFVSGL
ncbi:MAG TPA: hypothetical protein PKN13_06925 [Accumulibacter sp.]|nr:hypothetical protein [Accumulibacter sp.]HNC17771.1 hypothetical protein [Accumulibacter sp.]HND80277.1 hypothetical protein [Accumulibacter sp.]HNL13699.1 hypothetical protein [Accumulibacter sp.]HNL77405.1 hypothetical protein [Accumulibacter sp.]